MKILVPLIATLFIHIVSPHGSSAQFGRLFGGGAEIETIETQQLSDLLNQQKGGGDGAKKADPASDFVLVDVRSDAEVNVSVIPGAITKAQYEKNAKLYENKTVVVYCTVGGRSGAYAKQLAANGVKVKNYKGSILQWVNAELPLQTLDGNPTNRVHTYSSRYRIPAKYEQVSQ
ncbi:MAG TPA: rhodanese-like domain-containing protein [Planctomycetaceae bacterium]|nr:rhodanese-like domain-containing protein [Planctomycetaceae bacterium]